MEYFYNCNFAHQCKQQQSGESKVHIPCNNKYTAYVRNGLQLTLPGGPVQLIWQPDNKLRTILTIQLY
jgi:hypothetical protein